jgi:Beta-lactamase enzyme family
VRELACAAVRRTAATVLCALALATPAAADAPPNWRPHTSAARAWAAQRQGDVSFAVRTERHAWSWRGKTAYRSASIVKAMLLVAYLRRADVRGRALRAGERALLDPMIRRSDNRAGSAVQARVGLAALSALARRAGMRRFVPHPVWGGSTVTADDQARLFLRIDRLVPRRHRGYAVGLLRGIVPGQRWGIPAALPHGWAIAFKGGWGKGVTRQVDHQAALLTNGPLRVSIAVLSADNPSDAYGAATLHGVAARLLRGLAGTIRARLVGVRLALGASQAPSSGGSSSRTTMTAKASTKRGIPCSSMHAGRRRAGAHSRAIAGNEQAVRGAARDTGRERARRGHL